MRASLGFRAGPLYLSTGNLLRSKPRKHSGIEITVWLIIAPFLLLYFTGVILWWLLTVTWTSAVNLATRSRTAAPTDAIPADDPAWTPTGRARR